MGATARESLGFWRSFRGWTQWRKGHEIIESIYREREREGTCCCVSITKTEGGGVDI